MDDATADPGTRPIADHVHEESDVAIRPLAMFLGSLMVGLAIVAALTAWLFDGFLANTNTAENNVPVIAAPRAPITSPELQVTPRRDLVLFRAHEAKVLNSTEWIDRKQGIVRIPIGQAVKLVAERGFPDWPKADVSPPGPDAKQALPANAGNGGSP